MKAPDKIYLTFTNNGHILESDEPIPGNKSAEYIRKDAIMDIFKNHIEATASGMSVVSPGSYRHKTVLIELSRLIEEINSL